MDHLDNEAWKQRIVKIQKVCGVGALFAVISVAILTSARVESPILFVPLGLIWYASAIGLLATSVLRVRRTRSLRQSAFRSDGQGQTGDLL